MDDGSGPTMGIKYFNFLIFMSAIIFKSVVEDICQRYPQVELYLKKKKLRNIANLLKSANGDNTELSIETFKQALSEVDTQMKNLPATAQVKSFLLEQVN